MKKYISGVIAITAAVVAVAFTYPQRNDQRAGTWFTYDVINTPPQNMASSYTLEGSHTACSENKRLCAIFIEGDTDGILQQSELNALLQQENPGTMNPTTFPGESDAVDFRAN